MSGRKTPYQYLMDKIVAHSREVAQRASKVVPMFVYPRQRLNEGWRLMDTYERTKAAEQPGWEVILRATDEGLEVEYRKKAPGAWDWQ